jgi:predicted O-methyltransferase YrrM
MALDPDIEALRKEYKKDKRKINIVDFGAGSKITGRKIRTIRSIANGGITIAKYSMLFVQLIRYFNCKNVIELGTSLGINTLYLASAKSDLKVTTFEGCTSLCEIARRSFHQYNYDNIDLVKGNIDETLPEYVKSSPQIDMIFFDANHRYQSTLTYLNLTSDKLSDKAILIIDDIYWSKEMKKVWQELKKQFSEALCIDTHQCGIIIRNEKFPKTKLRFAF